MSSESNDLKIDYVDGECLDQQAIPCPGCGDEEIVVDLRSDAIYRCRLCDYEFETEVELRPFSETLFDLTPLVTFH